jgi:hypothetical protein
MNIEVDYNPTPSKNFFISVSLNSREAISFDNTSKGQRILKQILIQRKKMPENHTITSEWDALIINNKKLVKKYHVRWVDFGRRDWVNNEVWEAKQPNGISKRLTEKLLDYSLLISDNYRNLNKFKKELIDFEDLLAHEIFKYLKKHGQKK